VLFFSFLRKRKEPKEKTSGKTSFFPLLAGIVYDVIGGRGAKRRFAGEFFFRFLFPHGDALH
jgi:hypothetical protein